MATANELLLEACASGVACLGELDLLRIIAQGASTGGGGGGGGGGTLSTDGTFAANSDLLYPSQKAAKTYVDAGVASAISSSNATSNSLYVKKAGDTMTGALLLPDGAVATPSLSHTADANTGLWFPAADTIALSTAGAERLRVLSTGEVGIGTTGPSGKLEVNAAGSANAGSLFVKGSTALSSVKIQVVDTSGGLGVVGTENGFPLSLITNNIERLTVLSDGNVGIGITAPLARLHVTPSASGTDYFRIDHSDGTPRFQAGAYTGATNYLGLWGGDIVPGASNYFILCKGDVTALNVPAGNIYFNIGNSVIWNVNPTGHFIAGADNTYTIGDATHRPASIDLGSGGIVLTSPDATRYRITMANGGTLSINPA